MSDPFRIEGPAVISFSGGRTSAYMLRRILDAYKGGLPDNVHAAFANTGREMPATLDFVQRCGAAWNVPIVWLEFTARRHDGYREVSHNSASRNGEPYAALIAMKKALPNPVQRWCTSELKVLTITRWVRAMYGYPEWANVVGIRADEAHRLRDGMTAPMVPAGVTKADVLAFWKEQPFDLRLNGPWEGNCDGCFLKSRGAIQRMQRDYPERMRWWAEQETAATFRSDREPYDAMAEYVSRNPRMRLEREDRLLGALESCGVMCGV